MLSGVIRIALLVLCVGTGAVWLMQQERAPVAAASPVPAMTTPTPARVAQPVARVRVPLAPGSGLSDVQTRFWRSCVRTFEASMVLSLIPFDKGGLCTCTAATLGRYGAQPDDGPMYALAADRLSLTVASALRGDGRYAPIRAALLDRYPGMKRQVTWTEGALFSAVTTCAEKDAVLGPQIDRLRRVFGR